MSYSFINHDNSHEPRLAKKISNGESDGERKIYPSANPETCANSQGDRLLFRPDKGFSILDGRKQCNIEQLSQVLINLCQVGDKLAVTMMGRLKSL